MEAKRFSRQYPECDHIVRNFVKQEITEDLAKKLALDDNPICPLYEKQMHDYERMKNDSLQSNKLLQCRWKCFVKNIEKRVKEPFMFPSLRDFHFVNSRLQYKPNETVSNRLSYRFQMIEGPGVDQYGQIPIPYDMTPRKTKRVNKVAKLKLPTTKK